MRKMPLFHVLPRLEYVSQDALRRTLLPLNQLNDKLEPMPINVRVGQAIDIVSHAGKRTKSLFFRYIQPQYLLTRVNEPSLLQNSSYQFRAPL
jgi:hypothetical protein